MLAGCSSGGENKGQLTKNDMCVTQIDSKSKVCYGDSKVDVEKKIGIGIKGITENFLDYDFGITVMYRDDVVAGLSLKEESIDIYKTSRNIGIGDSNETIKEVYSTKYGMENAEQRNLDYFYYTETNSFIGKTTLDSLKELEEKEKVYMLSFMFDSEGNADRIWLTDYKMATIMN